MNTSWSRKLTPYLLIMPNLLIYLVFIFIPVICVAYLSFTNYNMLNPAKWIGWMNYKRMLHDDLFLGSVKNTLLFWVFTVIPQMCIGLVLAVLLNNKIRGMAVFRAGLYLPSVISSVAVAMTWFYLYDFQNGPFNFLLNQIGLTSIDWMHNPSWSLAAIIFLGIWVGIGYAMIIYLAALQSIPDHLYEAAGIDGATGIVRFLRITVPMLKPMTFFLFVTSTIRSFQVFDFVYIMTHGGPVNSTNTIVNEIVQTSFGQYEMGYASAMSIFLLLITLLITLINYRVGTKVTEM